MKQEFKKRAQKRLKVCDIQLSMDRKLADNLKSLGYVLKDKLPFDAVTSVCAECYYFLKKYVSWGIP